MKFINQRYDFGHRNFLAIAHFQFSWLKMYFFEFLFYTIQPTSLLKMQLPDKAAGQLFLVQ